MNRYGVIPWGNVQRAKRRLGRFVPPLLIAAKEAFQRACQGSFERLCKGIGNALASLG